jgi:hypothetical protein
MRIKTSVRSNGGRLGAVLFDSNYNKITTNGVIYGLYYYDGYYIDTSDLQDGSDYSLVSFTDNVAYAFIGITNGSEEGNFHSVDYFLPESSKIIIRTDKSLYEKLGDVSLFYMNINDEPATLQKPTALSRDKIGTFARKINAESGDPIG